MGASGTVKSAALCETREVSQEFTLPNGKPLRVLEKIDLAVRPGEIVALLGARIDANLELTEDDPELIAAITKPVANRLVGEPGGPTDARGRRRAMYAQSGHTAIISIVGSLVNRGAYLGANSGLVSYEGLSHQVEAAVADHSVGNILLDIDSPGGEATGHTCGFIATGFATTGFSTTGVSEAARE